MANPFVLQTDEEGSTAAAATAVMLETESFIEPTEFKVDQPFAFMIQLDGHVTFFGRYTGEEA